MYNKFRFLFVAKKLLEKINIDFVTNLLLNKYYKIIYNLIFVIVDYYTKIIKYIFVIIRIDIAKLAKIFFNKIVLYFEILINIVSNKKSIFISIFYF